MWKIIQRKMSNIKENLKNVFSSYPKMLLIIGFSIVDGIRIGFELSIAFLVLTSFDRSLSVCILNNNVNNCEYRKRWRYDSNLSVVNKLYILSQSIQFVSRFKTFSPVLFLPFELYFLHSSKMSLQFSILPFLSASWTASFLLLALPLFTLRILYSFFTNSLWRSNSID